MRTEDILICNTKLGSWRKTMDDPSNWWCRTVCKFNVVSFLTITYLLYFWG